MEQNLLNSSVVRTTLTAKLDNEPLISNSKVTQKQVESIFKKLATLKDTPTFDGSTLKNDKEFNKNLVRCYKKLCKIAIQKSSDYNFLRGDFFISIPQLDNILLYLMFNQTLSTQDIIKYIKGIDVDLERIISLERILINYNTIKHNDFNDENSEEIVKLTMLLNTLTLIKCIKFGLSKYDIDYFDKNSNPKKIYTGLKIVSCNLGLICMIHSKPDSYKQMTEYIRGLSGNESFNGNNKDDLLKLYDYILDNGINYINQESDYNVLYSLDYLKVLFKEDFKNTLDTRNLISSKDIAIASVSSKLFFNRKILIPKSGVILLVKNHPFIESILIKEKYLDDINNIVYITRFKDGTEIPNVTILKTNLGQDYPQLIVDSRLNNEIRISHYIFHFLNVFKEGMEDVTLVEYDVISPSYWKYRNKNYISQNDTLRDGIVVKREFEVEIAPYLRKINGEPSKEAKALAKKLCISLEEGYTIVKPHTRVYNKVK